MRDIEKLTRRKITIVDNHPFVRRGDQPRPAAQAQPQRSHNGRPDQRRGGQRPQQRQGYAPVAKRA